MNKTLTSPSLNLLRNSIDFRRVPFSDRGSRLMVFLKPEENNLYIRLAERLTSVEPDVEAYLQRPPFIHDLVFVGEDGEPLAYELETYPHALYFATQVGDFGLAFQDNRTLSIGLPSGRASGVHFHVSPQFWRESPNGGVFKSIRNLAYATNGETMLNSITPARGGYTVEFIVQAGDDCSILLNIGNVLSPQWDLLPFSQVSETSEKRWQDWFASVPPVDEKYRKSYTYAWWVMANNLIQPQGAIAYEAMMPSKVNYVGLWLWDSAMHALAYRHVNPVLARNQIRSMLTYQLPDGMLPDAVYDEGVIYEIDHPIRAEVTKPPILAWAALKLHETDPDIDFLQEIYVPLVRWNAWWFSMNDDDVDGLVQYNHPYSSGLDNNPLWDYGMPVESPDLNTYLCVQMGSLAEIAEKLGMDAEGAMWRRRAKAIVERMIQSFWDEEAGVFRALHEEQPIPVITPFNLYPLWTGQLPDGIRNRLLGHLLNPQMLWGDYVIPSVARNDPHYDPESMWRGPVWVNINYFFIEALRQIGENDLALELTRKTLDLIASHPSMYEYYNSMTGEPAPLAADAFGWTAAVFIDLAIAISQEKEKK
jgi:putative isomerase